MKSKCLFQCLLLLSLYAHAQTATVQDYKTKTAANAKERSEMLDALRSHLYKNLEMTLEFYVDHLKVSNNYAWFQGTADRKDGKKVNFSDREFDCCHVEALLQKKGGKWMVAEGAAFSTDVWYEAIAKKYPGAPKDIFPKDSPALMEQ